MRVKADGFSAHVVLTAAVRRWCCPVVRVLPAPQVQGISGTTIQVGGIVDNSCCSRGSVPLNADRRANTSCRQCRRP